MKDTKTIKRETRVAQLEREEGEIYRVTDFCKKFGVARSTLSKLAPFGGAKLYFTEVDGRECQVVEITPMLIGWAKNASARF